MTCNPPTNNLLNKIKHRLLTMDLLNQMDKAKELTHFALTHQAISKEDKDEFTCWLQSMTCVGRNNTNSLFDPAVNSSTNRSSLDHMTSGPPQVTISGVSGHIVQYNALSSPIGERTSRPWRSNSLTPPATDHHLSASPSDPWNQYQTKGRSHSLTYVREPTTSEGSISPASSMSMMEEKEVEEIVKNLPEGCGMKDIREWLKSLRLHKYTKLILEYTYEEFLDLTDETLEKRNVTLGARGKIIKNIGLVKYRPQKLNEMAKELEEVSHSNDCEGLAKILCDLEAIVLMPLKPAFQPLAASKYPNSRLKHSELKNHQPLQPQPHLQQHRANHDSSGSDSGTEHDHDTTKTNVDIPAQIFEILKSISTEIFVKEYTNHQVVTVFACLLEKCTKREAYSSSQKYLMANWLSKLKTLWNPPQIKKATDYKKRPYNVRPGTGDSNSIPARRLSNPRNQTLQQPSQQHQQQQQQQQHTPTVLQQQQPQLPSNPSHPNNSSYNPMYNALQIPFTDSAYFSPRRSMPEIKPAKNGMLKRNSYQEESKFNLDGLRHAASSSFYGGGGCLHSSQSDNTRRESSISTDSGYLMSLPESRRDSAEVENFRENNMMYKNNGQQQHFKREEFLDTFNSQPKVMKPNYGTARRDSDHDFLTVESAFGLSTATRVGAVAGNGNVVGVGGCVAGSMLSPGAAAAGGMFSLKNPGSMSSGCASDGSTDSLLEQDLHNLSLSVTQQALE